MDKKLKLLIVDDSLVFRRALAMALKDEPTIEIVGSVFDGKKAMNFINKYPVDLVTLDVEMPEMDGVEVLKAIKDFNAANPKRLPIGVIMVSALTQTGADITYQCLELGAFDFVCKPSNGNIEKNLESLSNQLMTRINVWHVFRNAAEATSMFMKKPETVVPALDPAPEGYAAVVIGISTGGPRALSMIMPELTKKISLPILIVQHMPPTFTKSMADQLNQKCRNYTVKEAEEGDKLLPKHCYIAPGGRHMTVKNNGTPKVHINDGPPLNGCRPSVDVLFNSVSNAGLGNILALVMTGMGQDGSRNLPKLKKSGAYVLAQDKETSVVWGMPGNAVKSGCVDELVSLFNIPEKVAEIIEKSGRNRR